MSANPPNEFSRAQSIASMRPANDKSSTIASGESRCSTPDARSNSEWSLLLVTSPDGDHALLYIYHGEKFVRNAIGRRDTLRNFAATEYAGAALEEKVLHGFFAVSDPPGICRVCGCTEDDCRSCIKRTGRPCSWANTERTLCTACAIGLLKLAAPGFPRTYKTTV